MFAEHRLCLYFDLDVQSMFITVKYGDGEEILCNPECKIDVLLHHLKKRCCHGNDVVVDLSDECGNVKYLRRHPESCAAEFLKHRESFVLLRVDKSSVDDAITYTPLLDDVFVVTSAFIERLARCSETVTKPAQTAKSTTSTSLASSVRKQQAVSKARNSFLASANKSRSNLNRSSSRNHSKERKSK